MVSKQGTVTKAPDDPNTDKEIQEADAINESSVEADVRLLVLELYSMDKQLKAEGHSLPALLSKVAATQYGLKVWPDPDDFEPANVDPNTD